MKAKVHVEITENNVAYWKQRLEAAAEGARLREAQEIADETSRDSAYLSGQLASSWHVVNDRASHMAWVESDDPNAIHQEFGTAHNPAHPALRPAAHRHEQSFIGRLGQAIKDAIA